MTTDRIALVRGTLEAIGTDALILTNPANRRWATGFTSAPGMAFSPDVAVITPSTSELVVAAIHVL